MTSPSAAAGPPAVTTEAWVLYGGDGATDGAAELVREPFTFTAPGRDEVLARPLYGAWEGNMDHAVRRSPVDVCRLRGEDRVVLGNAGVVEVLETGEDVTTVRAGDVGVVFCNGEWDEHGFPIRILGYDAPGTMGVLARRMRLHEKQIVPVPPGGPYTLQQWAAFSLRYITAWANWRVAWGCFRAQLPEVSPEDVHVWAWGGGVALAEIDLARRAGCQVAMLASRPERLALLSSLGIQAVDRSALDPAHLERDLLAEVRRRTGGRGISIFVDNLGVHQNLTLKALAREGVVTTSGWKYAHRFPLMRPVECQGRHLHVFTHYARYDEGRAAVAYALDHGWMPPVAGPEYAWDEIPRLAEDYAAGRIDGYFPIFQVNEKD